MYGVPDVIVTQEGYFWHVSTINFWGKVIRLPFYLKPLILEGVTEYDLESKFRTEASELVDDVRRGTFRTSSEVGGLEVRSSTTLPLPVYTFSVSCSSTLFGWEDTDYVRDEGVSKRGRLYEESLPGYSVLRPGPSLNSFRTSFWPSQSSFIVVVFV